MRTPQPCATCGERVIHTVDGAPVAAHLESPRHVEALRRLDAAIERGRSVRVRASRRACACGDCLACELAAMRRRMAERRRAA